MSGDKTFPLAGVSEIPGNLFSAPVTAEYFFQFVYAWHGLAIVVMPSALCTQCVGAWRSLVAYLNGVQRAGGSNPLAPTILTSTITLISSRYWRNTSTVKKYQLCVQRTYVFLALTLIIIYRVSGKSVWLVEQVIKRSDNPHWHFMERIYKQ